MTTSSFRSSFIHLEERKGKREREIIYFTSRVVEEKLL